MLRVTAGWHGGLATSTVRRKGLLAPAVLAQALHAPAPRPERSFASEAASDLASRLEALRPHRRGALASKGVEVAAVFAQASTLGTASLKEKLDFRQLCGLCRVLTAGFHLPAKDLLEVAAAELQQQLIRDGAGGMLMEDADAAAELALAVCEAGHKHELGVGLVEALCSAGVASKLLFEGLSGVGAANLALAAAAVGRADAPLLDALFTRCSAREPDLDLASLGDIRLAAALAGADTVSALDVRSAGFLRTLCSEVPFDDAREMPQLGEHEALTPLELEVSEALHTCETPHSRGAVLNGVFFPLLSHARNGVICAEHPAAFSTYVNAPDQRTAWQCWKYKVVANAGFKVFTVPEAGWRALAGTEERAAFMQQVLQNPLDVEAL